MSDVTGWRCAFVAAFAVAFAAGACAEPPIWRVTGPKGSAVLFGSVHLLPKGLTWRTPALTDAVAAANEIWFEIPIGGDDDQRAADILSSRGSLPRGDSLAAHLTPEMLRRLHDAAVRVGLTPSVVDGMRPWLADATLSVASDARTGALTSQGVERQIDAIAASTARHHALETVGDQVGALADGSIAEQIDLLAVTLDELELKPDAYRTLVSAWVAGDVAAIRVEALDPLHAASPRAYRALITDRNRRWARRIERRLARPGRLVVVVGVGHLVGPESLPFLLRAARLRVDGPME